MERPPRPPHPHLPGFHGYRKLPNAPPATPGLKLQVPEVNRRQMMESHHSAAAAAAVAAEENECIVREQDRFMPIANVIRIMRKILPPHAKISDDAKETIQECVSEYIGFITSEANERCQSEQRKTVTAEDVLWAMSRLGFDDYIEPLTLYLHRYREVEGDRGGSSRGESVGKRGLEYGATGVSAALGPPFQMSRPSGYYGAAMGNYTGDGNNAGSSHAAPTNDEQDEQYK